MITRAIAVVPLAVVPIAVVAVAVLAIAVPAGPPVVAPARAFAAEIDAATGYRMANYRSPVTLPPVGGTRASLDDLDRLRKDGAVVIDVMPARAGYDPVTGAWRLADRRADIPQSVWLPNVGQGTLEPRLAAYFASSLRKLTAGDPDRQMVFYCMADCWMSWNAVKRAGSLGYKNVYWFAEGSDGWAEAGRDLVEATPPPVPSATGTQ